MVRKMYYFNKRIRRAVSNFYSEIVKPESFIKGEDFENFLRRAIYTEDKYDLVMKTHNYNDNKHDYIEITKYPDFMFRDKQTGDEFYVEAKYRENLFNEKVEWCKMYQFDRYKEINKSRKVVVAIGLGGRPRSPKSVFIMPLDAVQYNALYPSFLRSFQMILPKKHVLDKVKDRIYDFK